ncbi:hypothetical protein NBRC116188_14950 [Oceaniserpentilla sp. 4NH20-0058]|uniref:DUF748 domain-containing protein n=1 Tax=Oceaniserpentilla sp. 4NH20-0058 TaxID=3127660 RepID=UPI00310951B0
MLFLNKGLKILFVIIVIWVVSIEWLIPFAAIKGVQNWYGKQGNDYSLDVESLNINPWAGSIIIQDVTFNYSNSSMNFELFELDLEILGLFDNQINIEKLEFAGSQVDLKIVKGQIEVLGLQIPMVDDPNMAPEKADVKESTPWEFSVNKADLNGIRFTFGNEQIHTAIDINNIKINKLSKAEGLTLSVDISINELADSNKTILLNKPSKLLISGDISDLYSQPRWTGNIQLLDIDTLILNNKVLLDSVSFNGVNIDPATQNIDILEISKLNVNDHKLYLDKYIINKLKVDGRNISSEENVFDGLRIKVEMDEHDKPMLLAKKTEIIHNDDLEVDDKKDIAEPINFHVTKIRKSNKQESNLIFINDNLSPKVNIKSDIKDLVIENITNKNESTSVYLNISFDEYSKLELNSILNLQKMNSETNLNITEFNLLMLNGYLEKMLGYHASQGLLNFDLKLNVKEDKLSGNAKVVVLNSKMEPSDADTVERVSKKISMPIETALSLLKDDKNNIILDIPIKGDIQDPDFGLNDLIAILSKRALKEAATSYLLQSFFPYTLVIDIVDYAGLNPFTIKLEPIELVHDQLTKDQLVYIEKISKILQQKTELQLYVCTHIKKTQELAENWQDLALSKANLIKKEIVNYDSELSKRVVLCKPELSDKSEIQLGF